MLQRTKRLRGRAGVEQRARRLAIEPLCRRCMAKGKWTVATRVDHILPLYKGGTDDDENCQSLCEPCHDAKTVEDAGGTPRLRARIGPDGWPTA